MRSICVLGSTGSVGTQTLEVARALGIRVSGLSAWSNLRLLAEQAQEFKPEAVAVGDGKLSGDALEVFRTMSPSPRVLMGRDGLCEMASEVGDGIVVNAVVGSTGIWPTLWAIRAGRDVALANKETLVAAGHHVMEEAHRRKVMIRPVDSEHSAIWQCLAGQPRQAVRRLILTASGGPFRDRLDLQSVTREEALAHPNWNMGPKISIDSATMVNKALEVVEARWLFDLDVDKIDVLVHRQSIVHSMVEFEDGCVMAQLGAADMRMPIQHALTYPERVKADVPRLDFASLGTLTFDAPDIHRFPGVALGHGALKLGGVAPAVMSAANEEAVRMFLEGGIEFVRITSLVKEAMDGAPSIPNPGIEQILEADEWARQYVRGRCSACTRFHS